MNTVARGITKDSKFVVEERWDAISGMFGVRYEIVNVRIIMASGTWRQTRDNVKEPIWYLLSKNLYSFETGGPRKETRRPAMGVAKGGLVE